MSDIQQGASFDALYTAGLAYWRGVATSADGLTIVACSPDYYCNRPPVTLISTDGGTTWSNTTTAGDIRWKYVAVSSDGTRIIAAPATGYVYVSLDQVDSRGFFGFAEGLFCLFVKPTLTPRTLQSND